MTIKPEELGSDAIKDAERVNGLLDSVSRVLSELPIEFLLVVKSDPISGVICSRHTQQGTIDMLKEALEQATIAPPEGTVVS